MNMQYTLQRSVCVRFFLVSKNWIVLRHRIGREHSMLGNSEINIQSTITREKKKENRFKPTEIRTKTPNARRHTIIEKGYKNSCKRVVKSIKRNK